MILENQFVWIDSISQAECGAQVSFEMRNLLDQRKQLRIHFFLVGLTLLRQLVLLQIHTTKTIRLSTESPAEASDLTLEIQFYLFLCVKDLSLLVLGSPQLLLLEVGVGQHFGDLHARDVHFGGCGDAELLVSSTQRHSVHSQRT